MIASSLPLASRSGASSNLIWFLVFVVTLSSCRDDDPAYFPITLLYGTWEISEIEYVNSTDQDCTVENAGFKFIFHPDSYFYKENCSHLTVGTFHIGEYTYDGRNTVTLDLGFKLKIIQLSQSHLTVEKKYKDYPTHGTFTYIKTCDPVGAQCTNGKTTESTGSDACQPAKVANWECA